MCIEQAFLMMSLLISSSKQAVKNIDGYLEPLIKKLKDLWIEHGEIYALNETFHMHAPLLWTIKDFQYMLSFRVVTLKIS